MKEFLKLAILPSVIRRALRYAIIVGCLLISINHGDVILRGEMDGRRLLKVFLTTLVPYVVSTLSSVAAMRECSRRADGGS